LERSARTRSPLPRIQVAARRLYERHGYAMVGERTLGPFTLFDYEKELV